LRSIFNRSTVQTIGNDAKYDRRKQQSSFPAKKQPDWEQVVHELTGETVLDHVIEVVVARSCVP
jgi:hypothetical protein